MLTSTSSRISRQQPDPAWRHQYQFPRVAVYPNLLWYHKLVECQSHVYFARGGQFLWIDGDENTIVLLILLRSLLDILPVISPICTFAFEVDKA